ncbi:MAG: beta-ketoacyl-[Desulfovibrionaceae bacterium]|nr:beta-ketoacyl-[acyl-carrier-protein] synthase family protein [Desulfovibrionaceae bacterium]
WPRCCAQGFSPMCKKRVVITGAGCVSPYGEGLPTLWQNLTLGLSAIKKDPALIASPLNVALAAKVPALDFKRIPRTYRRTMSPMSIYACLAAREALENAKLDFPIKERIGVAIGSTMGSPSAIEDFFTSYLTTKSFDQIKSTTFFKTMSHTVAANVALYMGASGRFLAPSAACASALTAIGQGYEAIAYGQEKLMLVGGADEAHVLTAATFERMGAASPIDDPYLASRPFDIKRIGLVIGEGAGILILEELEAAKARHAPILAEILSYANKTSPKSIAQPATDDVEACMALALDLAKLNPSDISYINTHATATIQGDQAEGQAIANLFGQKTPTSSLKGLLGHTLAASGAIELIACLLMLKDNFLLKNYNLTEPDQNCGQLNLLLENEHKQVDLILKNSFALGGIYTSIVISKNNICTNQ